MTTFINVPYTEKDAVKALGARWNKNLKKWYVPDGTPVDAFEKWEPWVKLLSVDLVPLSACSSNLRSVLSDAEWELCKRFAKNKSANVCSICGGVGPKHPVECHERWKFDEETGVQSLITLEALCPDCHEVTHMGLARKLGKATYAMSHLRNVNRWDQETAEMHTREAFALGERRSKRTWILDVSWLKETGIKLSVETLQKIEAYRTGTIPRRGLCH